MGLRFPLYAKILLWFFLNLLLLAGAFLVLVRAEFHSGYDWLLAAGAGQRIQAVSDLIMADLESRPRPEYDQVLKRFSEAYQLQFYLFDNGDGREVAGEPVELPPAVRAHIPERPRAPARAGLPGNEGPGLRPEARPDRPLPPGPPPARDNPKHLVRTSDPTRYWVVVRVNLRMPDRPRPMPATLAVMSGSLSGGGLFFDFKPWLAASVGAVVLSALLWFPLVRSLTRSIGQMTQTTRQIAEGHFDGRADERRRDELGALGQSINRMAARLDGFVHGQKRFLGDIAHELCAPIARIQMALGILEQRADEKSRPYVEDLREEVQHMSNLVNELLSFSKASLGARTIQLKPVLIRAMAEDAVQRESTMEGQIRVDIPADVAVMAERELLVRALANLLRNAMRYAGQAGPIALSARREGREAFLTISDSGPGVPETELARIFDPFYRLDASRDAATGGVGLGLAIVKTCVESCGGSVSCRNRQPSGLEVTIRLEVAGDADLAQSGCRN